MIYEDDPETYYLQQFGLPSTTKHQVSIHDALKKELEKVNRNEQDTLAMRVLCAQLYSIGDLEDILTIWKVKRSCFDAHFSIDLYLFLSAGFWPTINYLKQQNTPDANALHEYLVDEDDYEAFKYEEGLDYCLSYYGTEYNAP